MTFPSDLPASFASRAAAAGLRPEDVSEHFVLGSGHGGQRRNKRSTAVQLVHHPTGTEVRCFHKRMQHQNRVDAWNILLEKLEERKKDIEQFLAREEHVEQAQKRRRSRRGQREVLEEKKARGKLKTQRKSIS